MVTSADVLEYAHFETLFLKAHVVAYMFAVASYKVNSLWTLAPG